MFRTMRRFQAAGAGALENLGNVEVAWPGTITGPGEVPATNTKKEKSGVQEAEA